MTRAERLAAVAVAAYSATRWAQTSSRVKAAVTALRGGTVVYRANFAAGSLLVNGRRAVVADSTFVGPQVADLTCSTCEGETILPCECGLSQECHDCEGTGRRRPTLAEWDALLPGPAIYVEATP